MSGGPEKGFSEKTENGLKDRKGIRRVPFKKKKKKKQGKIKFQK